MKHLLKHREEFELCLRYNVNPLFYNRWIKLHIDLRIALQREIFGRASLSVGDTIKANDRYYRYCFEHSCMICENCGTPLYKLRNLDNVYSATYVSHILKRSGHPEMAHDPRNHNILCARCHDKWEEGNQAEMMIFMRNQIIIKEMRDDYMY